MPSEKIHRLNTISTPMNHHRSGSAVRCAGWLIAAILTTSACHYHPRTTFDPAMTPPPPDYSHGAAWAALPDRKDFADSLPNAAFTDVQSHSEVDIFYLHPTSYTYYYKPSRLWNSSLEDEALNQKTDASSILYQSSIFNGVGRIYAPRYRQAHIHAYFARDKASAEKAFRVAYADIRQAFQYYLQHYNQGRPFFLVSHSQGTTHAEMLIREFIDGQPLQHQLVAAYLIGMPVSKMAFQQLHPCESPDQTGCYCSWRTFRRGYEPRHIPNDTSLLVTNPLDWTISSQYVPASQHQGAVLQRFDKVLPQICDAQVNQGILWVKKPKFPGSFLYFSPNFHVGDMNFFYVDIRNNARRRAEQYLLQRGQP